MAPGNDDLILKELQQCMFFRPAIPGMAEIKPVGSYNNVAT